MFSEYDKYVYEELFAMQNIKREEGKEIINSVLEHVADVDYNLNVIEDLIVKTFIDNFSEEDLEMYKQDIFKVLEKL